MLLIGTGAAEFARSYVEGYPKEVALERLKLLNEGRLHNTEDKRIKRCATCSYFYRDKTKPNNSKTCSKECKIKKDTVIRAAKKPKKLTQRDTLYHDHYEYSYWVDEEKMRNNTWKYEVPYSAKQLEQITTAKRRVSGFYF